MPYTILHDHILEEPYQYLNLTTTLKTIKNKQIRSLYRDNS